MACFNGCEEGKDIIGQVGQDLIYLRLFSYTLLPQFERKELEYAVLVDAFHRHVSASTDQKLSAWFFNWYIKLQSGLLDKIRYVD